MNFVCTLLFLGNDRHHMPILAKIISSWVRTVVVIAKAHMSPSTCQDAALSIAFPYVHPVGR